VTALVLSGFAVLLLSGQYVREGPVLVTLTATHGIHRGDLGVAAAWLLGMIGLLAGVLSGRRRVQQPPRTTDS